MPGGPLVVALKKFNVDSNFKVPCTLNEFYGTFQHVQGSGTLQEVMSEKTREVPQLANATYFRQVE